jgi:hypothetical protein
MSGYILITMNLEKPKRLTILEWRREYDSILTVIILMLSASPISSRKDIIHKLSEKCNI